MNRSAYHFLTYFSAHAGLYRQLVRLPMSLLVLPLLGRRAYQFYIVNKRPIGYAVAPLFPTLAPPAGLRRRLVRRPVSPLVYLFCQF